MSELVIAFDNLSALVFLGAGEPKQASNYPEHTFFALAVRVDYPSVPGWEFAFIYRPVGVDLTAYAVLLTVSVDLALIVFIGQSHDLQTTVKRYFAAVYILLELEFAFAFIG